jgi:amidase
MNRQPVAFVEGVTVARPRALDGPLAGLTFAVKDNIALRGHRSSAGHPAWAASHEPAPEDAPVVAALLAAGADLVGVTILDELAYGLSGINPHYGVPTNARAPGRLCGGSSCGSAAAVGGCLCDFALGTDTAGSVRVPAALCGLFGMRPSFGALSMQGVVPLAPTFDTLGFMARDALTFDAVARVLFGPSDAPRIERILVADDAFGQCDLGVLELTDDVISHAAASLGVAVERVELAPEGFDVLRTALRRLQAREAWDTLGSWIEAIEPGLSSAVAERFALARELHLNEEGAAEDNAVRMRIEHRLEAFCGKGTLLVLPPVPGVAPRVDASAELLDAFRARSLALTASASLAGLPQLVVPLPDGADGPRAVSFVAARGADAWLAGLAPALGHALGD